MQVVEAADFSGKIIVISELIHKPNFSVITFLNLSRCEIRDLDNFPHFPVLEKLILQHNKIEKGLIAFGNAHLDLLNSLDISNNPLWNFCEILFLERLPRLNHFSCLNCPVMETPFLRKMCFGYLYNLHSLNGKEESNEIDWSDCDEPAKTKSFNLFPNNMNDKKKKPFKLYNDFSHCPIISKQTWYKKLDAPVSAETLKRQISHVEDKGTVYGPVEKKRKEFDLNKEDDGDETQSMEEDSKKDLNALNATLVGPHVFEQDYQVPPNFNSNGSHNYSQSNTSQNANGTHSIPNTNYDRGIVGSDEDDDDSNYNGDDSSESSALEVQGYGEGSYVNGQYVPWSPSHGTSIIPRHDEEEDAEESDSETLSEEMQHRPTQ
jgi:hypothetical protein